MKQYIISLVGAALLSSIAHMLAPASWVKYVKIITGLVILSVIIAPLSALTKINLFSDFSIEESKIEENLQITTVATELENRIEQDIKERIKDEFFEDSEASVSVTINENNEITGVTHIKIYTAADKDVIKTRMNEVYGIKKDEVEVYEP